MSKRFLLALGLFVYFSFLGILFTYPLIRYINKGLPYSHAPSKEERIVSLTQGDYLQLFYTWWLFKDALAGGSPFFKDPYQLNVPQYGMTHVVTPQGLPVSILFAGLAFLFGDGAAYNLFLWLTFPLAGIGLYLLAYDLTRSRWASLIGSTVYCLYPYRMAHLLGGHPGGFLHFLIPWVIYFYLIGMKKKSPMWGLWGGIFYLTLGMNEFHVAYYLPVFLGPFIVFSLFDWTRIANFDVRFASLKEFLASFKKKQTLISLMTVMLLGSAFGLFLVWWVIRRFESPWVWGLVLIGSSMIVFFWFFYSFFLSALTGRKIEETLYDDRMSYSPLLFFIFYPIQFYFDIPGFGTHLLGGILAMMFLLKFYQIWKWRGDIENKNGFSLKIASGRWKVLICFMFPSILLFAWLLYEKWTKLDKSVLMGGRPLSVIRLYSPVLSDLWKRFQYDGEKLIYPGVFAVLLSFCSILLFQKRRRFPLAGKWKLGFLIILFLVTYHLSFGPNLDFYFPLYRFFYENIPHFNYIRVPTRLLYLAFFFLSLLCAYGVKSLFCWVGRSSNYIACVCLIAIGFDYYPASPPGISLLPSRQGCYEHVKSHLQKSGRILEIPLWPGESSWSSIYQFYAMRYRLAMINGYRPAIATSYIENVFKPLVGVNTGEMNFEMWRLLKSWNVRFILVHEDAFPAKVSSFPAHFTTLRLKNSPYLKFVMRENEIYLFEVLDQAVASPISEMTSPMCSLIEAEHLKRRFGQEVLDENASAEKVVQAQKGNGLWLFGKSKGLPTGHYFAAFKIKCLDHADFTSRLTLEIWDKQKELKLAASSLYTKDVLLDHFEDFYLFFNVSGCVEAEPRVFWEGLGKVQIDRICLGFQDSRKSQHVYEAEALLHQGLIQKDEQASQEEAVMALAHSPRRDLVYGPYQIYAPGNYSARFWLKTDSIFDPSTDSRIATVLITTHYGKQIIAEKKITRELFKGIGGYHPFLLPFVLKESKDIELTVRFEGGSELWVDRIEVLPRL